MDTKKLLSRLSSYGVLALFAFIAVFPVTRILTISMRPGDQLLSRSLALIPDGASLENFRVLLTETDFLRWLGNSLLVSIVVTITGVALASTAGYALSRHRFRGRKAALSGILVTQMFPATMLLLPLYIVLIKLGLINSYLGIIVIYTATALPFCVWQMKGYYDTIPASLEEAARIDGASAVAGVLQSDPASGGARARHHGAVLVYERVERVRRSGGGAAGHRAVHAAGGPQRASRRPSRRSGGSTPQARSWSASRSSRCSSILSRYLISGLTLGAVKG